MRIRLTRKLALTMNGVDVSKLQVGDTLELDPKRADSLIISGWAEAIPEPESLPPLIIPNTTELAS